MKKSKQKICSLKGVPSQFSCSGLAIGGQKGYTLVELMVSMFIGGIVLGAMYSTYTVQRRTQAVQESTSVMQQNIRAALVVLSNDLKMAGFDPQGTGDFGFVDAATFNNGASLTEDVTTNSTTLAFTADLDGDGIIDRAVDDINNDNNRDMSEMEQVAYRLNTADNTLQRYSTTSGAVEWQIVAENIQDVRFNFLNETGATLNPVNTANADDIRTVQIALLARSEGVVQQINSTTYTTPGTPWATFGPFNDYYQRRLLVTSVKLRNMGLQ